MKLTFINFSKELDSISENLFKKEKIEITSLNEIIQDKKEETELYSIKTLEEESFSENIFEGDNGYINDKGISKEEMIKSLNYCLTYLKMKEISTNEKYFIFFSSSIKVLMETYYSLIYQII